MGSFDGFESPVYDEVTYWEDFFPTNVTKLQGTGGSVAIQVLDKFGISVVEGATDGSDLPGMDIKNMQASQALNISLAAEIIDDGLKEVYINGAGTAEFVTIGENTAEDLDVRYTIPSSTLKSPIDLVIVRGYDPPVRRWLGNEVNYLKDKVIYGVPDDVINNVCGGGLLLKTAYITFDDLVLTSTYQEVTGYETSGGGALSHFDNHTGFIFKIDNDNPDTVSWSVSNTTRQFIDISTGLLDVLMDYYGDSAGDNAGCWAYTIEGGCSSETKIGPFRHPDAGILDENDNPMQMNDFESVARVFFLGREIISASAFLSETTLSVRHEKSIMEVPSDDWTSSGETDPNSSDFGKISICFKRVVHTNESALYALSKRTINTYSFYDQAGNFVSSSPSSAGEWIVDFAGKRMGWVVEKMWLEVIRNKPCIVVNDEAGNALAAAGKLNITAYPVFTSDNPAPIGTAEGDTGVLFDQEEGFIDSNPTTLQEWTETSDFILEAKRIGNVVEVNLPFLEEGEVADAAAEIWKLYDESNNIQVKTFVCGPGTDVNLGDSYGDGIINSIEYSYQDSSSYNVTITTGPKLERALGLSQSIFQLETEEVNTSGIITQIAGNGSTYTIHTPRFGSLPAYNGTIEDFQVGDKVNITMHNHPKISFGGVY